VKGGRLHYDWRQNLEPEERWGETSQWLRRARIDLKMDKSRDRNIN